MFSTELELVENLKNLLIAHYQSNDVKPVATCEVGLDFGILDLFISLVPKSMLEKRLEFGLTNTIPSSYDAWVIEKLQTGIPLAFEKIAGDLRIKTETQTNRLVRTLRRLVKNGFLEKVDRSTYLLSFNQVLLNGYNIAIEAKLINWRKGLRQAVRHSVIADERYLAVPFKLATRLSYQLSEFEDRNVGLIGVAKDSLKFLFRPIPSSPLRTSAALRAREMALAGFFLTQMTIMPASSS